MVSLLIKYCRETISFEVARPGSRCLVGPGEEKQVPMGQMFPNAGLVLGFRGTWELFKKYNI